MKPPFKILSICKGGGYKYCRTDPPHPRRNSKNLYPLHRVVAENKLGRLLKPKEQVHHIDGDKDNNDPSNLEVLNIREHARHHKVERYNGDFKVQCKCGKFFTIKPYKYRYKIKTNKSRSVYCSVQCAVRFTHPSNGR